MSKAGEQDALSAAAAKAFAAPFDAVIKLAPEDGAPLWVDGRKTPPVVSADAPKDVEANCLWRGRREALVRAMASARSLEGAYVAGRIAVAGDMSVMARLKLEEGR